MRSSDRDSDLGEQLRRLETPEHGPDFFARLEQKLEMESSADERSASRTTRHSADAAGNELAREREAGRPRSRSWLRLAWVPIPVAAVILALLWAFAGPLGIDVFRPQTASAAEIKEKMVAALAQAEAIKGTLVVRYYDEATGQLGETRWNVVTTARGDFRMTGVSRSEDIAYDASSGVQRVLAGGDDGEPQVASEMTGLAPGWPDPGPADWVLFRGMGAVVRAMLAAEAPSVSEATFDRRPAWVMSAEVQPNRLSTVSGDHIEITVDQQTGFPVEVSESKEGRLLQELRLEGVQIDPALTGDEFVLAFPEGVEVERNDQGFRRVSLEQVAEVVGYQPLVPAVVPEGYKLAEIAVAEGGWTYGQGGDEPLSRGCRLPRLSTGLRPTHHLHPCGGRRPVPLV